ncbi:MAG: NaMN--DMB phosphoribosyltransferase [Prochlorococcaceae cyanobacterium]
MELTPLLLLAGTETAAIEGISAAGASAQARRFTAAADAELLLLGPAAPRGHALPPRPAGVSPALIGHVVRRALQLLQLTQVIDLGAPVAPAVPHLRLPAPESSGPAACLSSGTAMPVLRVERLLQRADRLCQHWPAGAPVLLCECVPGGTSTALAVLEGLGIAAIGLVGGSLRQPVHGLKAQLVQRGLAAAGLQQQASGALAGSALARAVLAAVGDPMLVLAAGLCLNLAGRGHQVVLAGGSQMAAVLALALALAPEAARQQLAAHAQVVTTAWVLSDPGNDLRLLVERIGQRWGVAPQLQASSLRFGSCRNPALRDYERGFIKEGVGAGGLAWLWEQSGRSPEALAAACDRAMESWASG